MFYGHGLRGVGGDGLRLLLRGRHLFARASPAGYEEADLFQKFGGGGGTFGEEGVGGEGALVGGDGAAHDQGGQGGVQLLGAADEFVAVHARKEQVGDEEVDGSRCGVGGCALKYFEGLVRVGDVEYAIASGFEEKGSEREGGFVAVDTEDDFLRAHGSFFLGSREQETSPGVADRRVAGRLQGAAIS